MTAAALTTRMAVTLLALAAATATAATCTSHATPAFETKDSDLNVYARDVVFNGLSGQCGVASIRKVVADLAGLGTNVETQAQRLASFSEEIRKSLDGLRGEVAHLDTREERMSNKTEASLADINAKLATQNSELTKRLEAAEAKLQSVASLQATVASKVAQQAGAHDQLAGTVAAANKGFAEANKKTTAALQEFRMPELKGWKHGAKCSSGLHGAMRRLAADKKNPEYADKIVVCNGGIWKQIAPINGIGSYVKIPGSNGCVMRDVYSFNTGAGGFNRIDMKTNIKIKSNTMFTIKLEGYNYGRSRFVDSSVVGYTYAGWSCVGQRHEANYGHGHITTYCSGDGYVVVRFYPQGSSYYLGYSMTARFVNPTGTAMCGKFRVTATKANSGF